MSDTGKGYPSRIEAMKTLEHESQTNPGNWVMHSKYVAIAAEAIAAASPGMDPEKAYGIGMMHDIGRHIGVVRARHQIEGYRYCMARGWTDCARICLTHSHTLKDLIVVMDRWDTDPEDTEFIRRYIENTSYDDYDLLIQLCDNLARSQGLCILEVRMIDVARRYGVGPNSVRRWNRIFELKDYFDKKTGTNLYSLLPGIGESTLL